MVVPTENKRVTEGNLLTAYVWLTLRDAENISKFVEHLIGDTYRLIGRIAPDTSTLGTQSRMLTARIIVERIFEKKVTFGPRTLLDHSERYHHAAGGSPDPNSLLGQRVRHYFLVAARRFYADYDPLTNQPRSTKSIDPPAAYVTDQTSDGDVSAASCDTLFEAERLINGQQRLAQLLTHARRRHARDLIRRYIELLHSRQESILMLNSQEAVDFIAAELDISRNHVSRLRIQVRDFVAAFDFERPQPTRG
jgi:hypothetical protein